ARTDSGLAGSSGRSQHRRHPTDYHRALEEGQARRGGGDGDPGEAPTGQRYRQDVHRAGDEAVTARIDGAETASGHRGRMIPMTRHRRSWAALGLLAALAVPAPARANIFIAPLVPELETKSDQRVRLSVFATEWQFDQHQVLENLRVPFARQTANPGVLA